MPKQQIGIVKELLCYPIKSMLGQRLNEAHIDMSGMVGDRAYALCEGNGRIVSAKNRPQMLEFQAKYDEVPLQGTLPPLRITLPDGRTVEAQDPEAVEALAKALGRTVTLERSPSPNNQAEFDLDPSTIFDGIPTEEVVDRRPEDFQPTWSMLAGSFQDEYSISVLTTGTLAHLHELSDDSSKWDVRRFRPNIFVETGSGTEGFVEDNWLDGTLEIGEGVRLTHIRRNIRCVMTTLPQEDLEKDMRIIRTALKYHDNFVGVGAAIEATGIIRVGDPVVLQT